jgi:hypothetical protein
MVLGKGNEAHPPCALAREQSWCSRRDPVLTCVNKLRLISCLLLTAPAFAQSFEVTSVKPDPPGPAPLVPGCAGGRFTARIGLLKYHRLGPRSRRVSGRRIREMASGSRLLRDRRRSRCAREPSPVPLDGSNTARRSLQAGDPPRGPSDDRVRAGPELFVSHTRGGSHRLGWRVQNQPGLRAAGPDGKPIGDGPDLFSALESQLGLELGQRKEPVETIVIDHIQPPNPN